MELLNGYWSEPALTANGLICLNALGALALGLLLGYERSFHGRAAGMRTYALVCMGAAVLTVICGFPRQWFGGLGSTSPLADPTRVIQGIVTGIGFLGAGVIMKEGFSIRGLSTAALIWTAAAIGVTIGLGFYATAIVTTLLCLLVMSGFKRLEEALPHYRLIRASLIYARDQAPTGEELRTALGRHGLTLRELAFQTGSDGKRVEYDLVVQSDGSHDFNELVDGLASSENLLEFRLSPVRD
jgi:putative Mg2+ transporter-C (MgtC) family protein